VSRRVATPLLVALLALGALRTVSYVRLWDDRERIYAYAADTQPRSIRVRLLLGHELTQRQAYVEAERVLREAAALAPTYDGAYFQLAAMELHRGDFDRAAAFVGQARAIRMSMRAEMALREIDRAREVAAAATRPAR
jgi:Flp pilus assembly protein TadD